MANLFEVLDFPNTFFGAEQSLYNSRKSGVATRDKVNREEYLSKDVDFYTTGLAESTGIKVSDPDRWSDQDDEKENKNQINVNQVGSPDDDETGTTPSEISELGKGFDQNLSISSNLNTLNSNYIDYNTSLQEQGFKDRSDSFLSKNFGITLASAPQSTKEATKGLKGLLSIESLAERGVKMATAMMGINPIATNLLGGFITGKTVKDPLGNASYRPDHSVLGTAMDINFSIQSNNIGASIAAMNANNLTGYGGAKANTGFFGYIGGQLVSRAPNGKTYTGVNAEQGRMAEAFSKGYAPMGYNVDTEQGEYSIGARTGAFSGYDERGYHVNANGFSKSGLMSDVRSVAQTYGIGDKTVISALEKVRSQYNFWGKPKDSTKPRYNLSQILAEKASSGNYTRGSDLGDAAGAVGSGKAPAGSAGNLNTIYSGGYVDNSNDGDGGDSGLDSSSDSYDGGGGGWTAKGGFIGKNKNFALNSGGEAEPAGFIEGPPEQFSDQTTIADDIPLKVKDGTFVINAPAVENEGSSSVQKMLAEGYEKAMTRDIGVDKNFKIGKIPSREELDIQISRGEVVVPPHVATVIGYDRLEKINNRGKREVERRQKAGNQEKVQAGQGFAATGGNQKIKIFRGEPYPEQIGKFDKKYMSGRRMTGAWFSSNKNYAKNYGDLQKTLDVTFDEYAKGARKAELYRNIAIMQSDSFSDKDYREKKGVLHLTKKQRQQLFKHVKEIKQFAKMVQDGKADPKRFVNSLHMSIFPDKKEQATIRKIESYKNNPKLFAKFVVRGLANNIVNKGIPLASKAIPGIGALAGFSPKEMGDATLSGKEGFIYDYNPKDNYIDPKFAQKVGTDTKDSMFAQKDPEFKQLDPKFARKNTTPR